MSLTTRELRVEPRVSVDLLLNKYIKGRPYLCRATNLSRRGILVHRVLEPRSEETNVGLQFQLPDDDRVITCAGEIVYEHEWLPATGVLITAIDPQHQKLIDDFITRRIDERVQ